MKRLAAVAVLLVLACGRRPNEESSSAVPDGSADSVDAETRDEGAGDGGAASADAGDTDGGVTDCTGGVSIASGCVKGESAGPVTIFRGLPYAAPPVGGLRWKPPVPAASWSGVRDATVFSKACPQVAEQVDGTVLPWDEDCLYLNVWTPKPNDAAARLPVMVWIHGGGLVVGSGAKASYEGRIFAEKAPAVVVSLNYRLAQLGYVAHPALSADDPRKVSGNYGVLDQIAALKWVKENIERFGGDPTNVTVFGESAGGLSVCTLLTAAPAAGLFGRAIIQSATCPAFGKYARPLRGSQGSLESSESLGERWATAVGCTGADTLTCLRAKTPEQLLSALPAVVGVLEAGEKYGYSVDGQMFTDSPAQMLEGGAFTSVPTMLGTTADEGTLFTRAIPVQTVAQYDAYVRKTYPATLAPQILNQYPAAAYPSPRDALNTLVTESSFACPTRRMARALQARQPAVFLYQFSYVTQKAAALKLGAHHGSEVEFVFGTLRNRPSSPPLPEELALSDEMLGYWSRFARFGDPNALDHTSWPRYAPQLAAHLEFAAPISVGRNLRKANCDFLDQLSP